MHLLNALATAQPCYNGTRLHSNNSEKKSGNFRRLTLQTTEHSKDCY